MFVFGKYVFYIHRTVEKTMTFAHNGIPLLLKKKKEWGKSLWPDMEWFSSYTIKWKMQAAKNVYGILHFE